MHNDFAEFDTVMRPTVPLCFLFFAVAVLLSPCVSGDVAPEQKERDPEASNSFGSVSSNAGEIMMSTNGKQK